MVFIFPNAAHLNDALKNLSAGSIWVDIGETLVALEESGSVDPQGVPWAQHVLNRLEQVDRPIASQQLRKIRRCYRFLKEEAQVDPHKYGDCPLSGIEIVAKVFALDADRGREQLEELRGGIPYTDLLRRYEELRSSETLDTQSVETKKTRKRAQPRERHRTAEELVHHWIEERPDVFFGEDVSRFFTARAPIGEFQEADLVFRYGASGEGGTPKYAGFEIKVMALAAPRVSASVVAQVNVAASFYDIFWLILTDINEPKDIVANIVALDLNNVGVATLSSNGQGRIHRSPSGEPFPDRRSKLILK